MVSTTKYKEAVREAKKALKGKSKAEDTIVKLAWSVCIANDKQGFSYRSFSRDIGVTFTSFRNWEVEYAIRRHNLKFPANMKSRSARVYNFLAKELGMSPKYATKAQLKTVLGSMSKNEKTLKKQVKKDRCLAGLNATLKILEDGAFNSFDLDTQRKLQERAYLIYTKINTEMRAVLGKKKARVGTILAYRKAIRTVKS